MNRYTFRVDYTVEAETEEEAWEKYSKGNAWYDSVYDIILEDEDIYDDEEEEE